MKSVSATDTLIPVPKDGKDAVAISVTPENIVIRADGARKKVRVEVRVRHGMRAVTYGNGEGQFTCSTLTSSGYVITDGVKWTFGSQDDLFWYELTVTAQHGEVTVPFTVTYGGTVYPKMFSLTIVSDGKDGVDGNWTSYVFRQSDTKPEKPSGTAPLPVGWLDAPGGAGKWWMSKSTICGATGLSDGNWSEPVQCTGIDGTDGTHVEFRYLLVKEGVNPVITTRTAESGTPQSVIDGVNVKWVSVPPSDTPGNALWMTTNKFRGTSVLGKWSTPVRISGEQGADAVRYWLRGSVTQIVRSALGTCTPSSVSCKAMTQTGNGAAQEYGDAEIKYAICNSSPVKFQRPYSPGELITVVDGMTSFEFCLYKEDVLVDTLTIPVVESGQPGERGRNGRLPVPYGEYDSAISYTATDLVAPFVLQEGKYYVMNKSVTVKGVSPKADYAANGTDATWLHMEFFRAVYAELLMARLGLIGKAVFYDEFMFSQYGRMDGKEVNYSGGYDIPTDAGGLFDPNIVINFLTGALRCRKADITGNINADSGRIGALAIRGNDLVGLVDGVETVRLGIGNVTDVTAAFETRSHEFAMSSTDPDCTTDVEMTRFGYHSGTARRPGEISENRDDGNYTEDTHLSCKISFKLDATANKVEFGRFDVGYNTRSGSFRGTAKGTAKLYRVSGSTRTKVSEWELAEQSSSDHEVSSLAAGNYEVDIAAWLVPAAGTVSEWWGETVFYATAIWVTSGALSGGKTEIARDGFLCYQGETRYLFFSKGKGLEVKFGNHGLKVGANGVQKLVSGTWKDINS